MTHRESSCMRTLVLFLQTFCCVPADEDKLIPAADRSELDLVRLPGEEVEAEITDVGSNAELALKLTQAVQPNRPELDSARVESGKKAEAEITESKDVGSNARVTQRRGYLVALEDVVGAADPSMWVEEFREVLLQQSEIRFGRSTNFDRQRTSLECLRYYRYETKVGLATGGGDDKQIRAMVDHGGWDEKDAEAVVMLLAFGIAALARANREGRKELASSLHALASGLARRAMSSDGLAPPLYMPMNGIKYPVELPFGLGDHESDIPAIEVPDITGARAVCTNGPLRISDDPTLLNAEGRWIYEAEKDCIHLSQGDVVCLVSDHNDSVALRTAVLINDSGEVPVYALPPNTLLTLEKVEGPPFEATLRRWHVFNHPQVGKVYIDRRETFVMDGKQRLVDGTNPNKRIPTMYRLVPEGGRTRYEIGPPYHPRGGTRFDDIGYDQSEMFRMTVNRRLLTMRITYLLPAPQHSISNASELMAASDLAESENIASKFGSGVTPLTYLDRRAYIRGTEELTHGLKHSMEHEWTRLTTRWTDYKGVEYSGQAVWDYVNGKAYEADCTPGRRDVGNAGMMPSDFRERINSHIRSRINPKPQARQLLTLDETLAVRLYTGPAFDPINWWLREVSCLPEEPPPWFAIVASGVVPLGSWTSERSNMSAADARRSAALDASTSFGATCGHLISAIRKIAAANTEEENARTLFRCARGALRGSFWIPDSQDMVCATDAAFMSTALEALPQYMAPPGKPTVIFRLHAAAEDDAYHCGAEVAMLSQFSGEREVLFPPLTMLLVLRRQPAPSSPSSRPDGARPAVEHITWSRERLRVTRDDVEGREVEYVDVLPSFTG
jgi:hypothetical protein